MINLKKIKKKIKKVKKQYIIAICSIFLIILVFIYGRILRIHINEKKFVENCVEISKKNEEQIFKIEKIVLCSSANALDLSKEQNLKNLELYQYTDIGIYINNGEELSNKNTVKELTIDNISLEGIDNIGSKSLNYKKMSDFGLKEEIKENRETNDIHFNIVYTNDENENADYNEATFYTDCSNPITLEYLNYNLMSGFNMDNNNAVVFDGSVLEKAGISVDDIKCRVKFKINILSNENAFYTCWVNFEIPLNDIYKGTTMKSAVTEGDKYVFFRQY